MTWVLNSCDLLILFVYSFNLKRYESQPTLKEQSLKEKKYLGQQPREMGICLYSSGVTQYLWQPSSTKEKKIYANERKARSLNDSDIEIQNNSLFLTQIS